MSIAVEIHGNVASIILSSGIDYSRQDEFKKANKQALSMKGVTEIHVNFAETTFMDSSGIRELLMLKREADRSGMPVILYNVNEAMREVFDIGGFDKEFTFR